MVGLHKEIEIAFLVVGHTKFAPDWCFGLLKRKFRREKVGCLADIARVVDTSATVNISQLCGTQTGEVLVPTHDWKAYPSQYFKTLRNIKSYHHFRFSSATPGSVLTQKSIRHSSSMTSLGSPPSPNSLPLSILLDFHLIGSGTCTTLSDSFAQNPSVTKYVRSRPFQKDRTPATVLPKDAKPEL